MNKFYEIFLSVLLLTFSVFSQNGEGDSKAELQVPIKIEETLPLKAETDISPQVEASGPQVEGVGVSAELKAKSLEVKEGGQDDVEGLGLKEGTQKEEVFAQETSRSLAIYFVLLLALLVGVMLLAWFIPAKSLKAED